MSDTDKSALARLVQGAVRLTQDAWENTLTGLGTTWDKLTAGRYQVDVPLDEWTLEALYDGNDLAARIVDAVVDDALRQGFELNIEPDEDDARTGEDTTRDAQRMASDVLAAVEDLEGLERLSEAWTWARRDGGAAIYVVVDDGGRSLEEPLGLEAVRRVQALTVLERRDLVIVSTYSDPAHPRFGRPEFFSVAHTGGAAVDGVTRLVEPRIHESRLILFEGVKTSPRKRQLNAGWALSVLQRPHDVIRNFETGWGSVAHVLQDAAQGVFRMQGLHGMVLADQEDAVTKRLQLVDRQRSVMRPLAIDKEDEFLRHAPPLSGYPEVLEKLMLRLAAAARMPVSVLMGQAPAGLNATGESDRLLWAQTVEAEQRHMLRPRVRRLLEVLMASAEGPTRGQVPERWSVSFPPLVHMTAEQKAGIRKTVAETDAIYIRDGVVLPEEVAISRWRGGEWSPEMAISTVDREELLEEDRRRRMGAPDELDEDPGSEPGDEVDAAEAPAEPEETPLAGGQIQQALDILDRVRAGDLPLGTAKTLLTAGLAFSPDEADALLAEYVDTFEAEPEDEPGPIPPGMPGGPPQNVPGTPPADDDAPGDTPAGLEDDQGDQGDGEAEDDDEEPPSDPEPPPAR
jgi:hypothetical protein